MGDRRPPRPPPTHPASLLNGLRAGATILHSAAFIITVYRLNHRYRIRRLSWDDAFAFFALLLEAQELVCLWWVVDMDKKVRLFPGSKWEKGRSILYWTISIYFTLIICSTRLSLWASIRRILAPGKLRTACIPLAAVTLLFSLFFIILKASTCNYTRSPRVRDYPIICGKGTTTVLGGVQSAVDITLSVVIIAVPLCAVWKMGLSREKRNLLMIVFTASCATLAAALVHNIYVLKGNMLLILFTSHYETAVSLIVCNIHIVVPTLYTKFKSDDDAEDSISTDAPSTGLSTGSSKTRITAFTDSNPLQTTCDFTSLSGNIPSSDVATSQSQLATSACDHRSTAPSTESASAQTNPPSSKSSSPRSIDLISSDNTGSQVSRTTAR
ncbi:hypothetical protein L218DRAFT_371678 [Marasmius fiardii PR-910]|nr:hypothetical protein L218DRAFT_371678 [Marasmius fiardii PR-910]